MKHKTREIVTFLLIVGMWIAVITVPAMMRSYMNGEPFSWRVIQGSAFNVTPLFVVFIVNYFFLVPRMQKIRKWKFFVLANIILVLLSQGFLINTFVRAWTLGKIPGTEMPVTRDMLFGMGFWLFMLVLVSALVIGVAFGIRYYQQWYETRLLLNEQQQKMAEAEISWLRNQLNPHFLFNTLNNISGLVQIDADKAQDSIAQLSDLLRYALYETNRERVPLKGEVDFLQNYIELMKLRCNEKTTVECRWHITDGQMPIAPLIFISPVENAFKHGVSASKPSFVRIALEQQDDRLIFTCDNSNYPKDDKNRSGSGVGMENLRRRLQLLYGGLYTFEQKLEGDCYHVIITLRSGF